MEKLNSYKVCFLGRTGNGKSTLINALYGTTFKTAPILSCTKELYTVTLMGNCPEGYEAITVYDTPGIGEFSSDSVYERFYEEAISQSDCIVLVTTLDRNDAPAQRLFIRMQSLMRNRGVRFIFALNHIDSNVVAGEQTYEAWDEATNTPSALCEKNIAQRKVVLHEKFDKYVDQIDAIVPASGLRDYGIGELKSAIENKG